MPSRNLLDKIVVVDLEATCWQVEPPPGEESEIIEIGLCLLDVASGQREFKESMLIRPERSTVSAFCTRLTTLTPEDVAAGMDFAEACALLRQEYGGPKRVWASYGDYDRRQLQRQCDERRVPYPFGFTHINIKNLASLMLRLDHEVSLPQAFSYFGWELEGTYHRGNDDAWNAARLLAVLLWGRR